MNIQKVSSTKSKWKQHTKGDTKKALKKLIFLALYYKKNDCVNLKTVVFFGD